MPRRKRVIEVARAYDPIEENDCYRALVDRLWPRGVKKEDLPLDGWWKELAPSDELRRWFNHDPERWDAFRERYFTELKVRSDKVSERLEAAGQ